MVKSKPKSFKLKPEHWLALITLFGLLLRIYFFVGLNWEDSPRYVWDAAQVAGGGGDIQRNVNGLRMMVIYPVGFFFWMFDVSEYSAAVYPLLCSLGGIVLIFYFGKVFFDEKTGLIAAFLLSFYPLDVLYSTQVMPDVPIAFFMAVSVFLFLKNELAGGNNNSLIFLSGLFTGIAYLARVSGLINLVFFIPYMVYRSVHDRKIRSNYAFFFAGMLLCMLGEGVFYSLRSGNIGDMTLRYRVVTGFFEDTVGKNQRLDYLPRVMLNLDSGYRFMWDNKFEAQYGLFYYLIIPAILYVLLIREKRAYPLVLWAGALFLWSNFGSMSLTGYKLMHRLARHMTIITVPCILVLSHVLTANLRKKGNAFRRALSIATILFLMTTSIYYIHYRWVYLEISTYDAKAIYNLLKDLDEKPVYCSPQIGGHLNFYFKYDRKEPVKSITRIDDCDEIKDSYVITNDWRGYLNIRFLSKINPCLDSPPDKWVLLKTITGPEIGVYSRYDPKVYYAP
jgi:4-amino-4-deoxy-L-arabinose transferase-like glycosyltransferase